MFFTFYAAHISRSQAKSMFGYWTNGFLFVNKRLLISCDTDIYAIMGFNVLYI